MSLAQQDGAGPAEVLASTETLGENETERQIEDRMTNLHRSFCPSEMNFLPIVWIITHLTI